MRQDSNIVDDVVEGFVRGTIGAGVPIVACIVAGGLIYGSFFLPEEAIPQERWFYRTLLAFFVAYIGCSLVFRPSPSSIASNLFRLLYETETDMDDNVCATAHRQIRECLQGLGFSVDSEGDEVSFRLTCRDDDTSINVDFLTFGDRFVHLTVGPTTFRGLTTWDRFRGVKSAATQQELVEVARRVLDTLEKRLEWGLSDWKWCGRDPHLPWEPPFDISVLTGRA